MSFQEDSTSGDFRTTLSKIKRRLTRGELTPEDRTDMLDSVHNMRTQIDMLKVDDNIDNLSSNAIGPYNLVFEPDTSEVKIYNNFTKVYGDYRIIDQTLGGIAYDAISIGDSPAILNDVTPGTYHYEPYLNFNGTSSHILVADTAALRLTRFSMAAWFRTSKNDKEEHVIVNKGGLGSETAGQNMNYGMWIRDTERFRFGFEDTSGGDHFSSSDVKFNDDAWHHAVVTYDQVTLDAYIDGVLHDRDFTSAIPETGTNPLVIGRNSRVSDSFFKGQIDEVRVWNVGLTQAEALALYEFGTVPQQANIVYSNTFGGSGYTIPTKRCYYVVQDGANNWNWRIGFHPPSIKNGNSIGLNVGTNTGQFIYYDGFGTDFDFTANNTSFGFWIYPTAISSTSNTVLMHRKIDADNLIKIEIDDVDKKLFGEYRVGGVSSTRQYDTPLTVNGWYYVNCTLSFSTPTLSLKVNNNADVSSSKITTFGPADTKLYFGGHLGAFTDREFHGYLAFPMWYKHATVLTTAERTSLYNYNTKSNTTKPFTLGFARLG